MYLCIYLSMLDPSTSQSSTCGPYSIATDRRPPGEGIRDLQPGRGGRGKRERMGGWADEWLRPLTIMIFYNY